MNNLHPVFQQALAHLMPKEPALPAKIVTSYIRPPIPTTRFDWMAHVEGEDEDGPTGYGPTEADAMRELAEQLAERQEQR